MLNILLVYWPVAAVVTVAAYLVSIYFHHGLNKYPGPLAAKFTNFWRLYDSLKGRHDLSTIELHKKYGSVVRISPNVVSLSDGNMVPRVFAINKGWTKSKSVAAFSTRNQGRFGYNLFSTDDEAHHTWLKKPVAGVYSQQSLTGYESLVDETIDLMMNRLEKEFQSGSPCNLSDWLQYYAFDVVLNITFSNTMGFLESGADAGGFMRTLREFNTSSSVYFHVPWLRYLWRYNPIMGMLARDGNVFPGFIRKQYQEHLTKFQEAKTTNTMESLENNGMKDFLYRFMAIAADKSGTMDTEIMFSFCGANVAAGSDTTAVALRAIIYFLLKNPEAKARLMAELREANLSYPVTWKESQSLPYLHACLEEASRLHPSVGFGLERVVPKGGCELPNGDVLPEKSIVSMNAWVINRDKSIYGADADEYVPERWLQAKEESDAAFETRLGAMKRTLLTFGWGKRICIGRNISMLEIYKLVPTLLLEYDIELLKDWEVRTEFFAVQENMHCRLKRRVR